MRSKLAQTIEKLTQNIDGQTDYMQFLALIHEIQELEEPFHREGFFDSSFLIKHAQALLKLAAANIITIMLKEGKEPEIFSLSLKLSALSNEPSFQQLAAFAMKQAIILYREEQRVLEQAQASGGLAHWVVAEPGTEDPPSSDPLPQQPDEPLATS